MANNPFSMMMMMDDGGVEVQGAPDPYTMAIFQNLQNIVNQRLEEKKQEQENKEKEAQGPEVVDEKTEVGQGQQAASSSFENVTGMELEEGEDENEGEADEVSAKKKAKKVKNKRAGKKKGKH